MSILASPRQTTRIMVYAMVCTLVIAFGTIGAVFAENFAPQYALMGLFLGSALGAFISVYEATIVGCMTGMIVGLAVSPLVYLFIDFETSYLMVFVLALFGAVMGEPMAYFWREAEGHDEDRQNDQDSEPNDQETRS
ncbi:MAG: hypothetical protein ACOYXC_16615 [Candidatus Rifleibacteriota bacterium]